MGSGAYMLHRQRQNNHCKKSIVNIIIVLLRENAETLMYIPTDKHVTV